MLKIDYQEELNPEQYQVVTQANGPCLVLAGAGSGKTRTIVYRVAYLIERGTKPDNILLLTFTNKAAREMLNRVTLLLKGKDLKGLWGGTFHHVANLILRKYAGLIGYQANFTILDEEDSQSLIKICLKELNINIKERRYPTPAVLKEIFSYGKNSGINLIKCIELKHPRWGEIIPTIKTIFHHYEQRKKKNNLMDFDDLLTNLLLLLKTQPKVREVLTKKFQYILVDEYQDTNRIQAAIVRELASYHHNVLVVGDDAQSIYSFRAADIGNILNFPKIFKGTKIFHLETNYRSTPEILEVANNIIAQNFNQFPKNLISLKNNYLKPYLVIPATASLEASFIAEKILELCEQGLPLNQIAVLFRATFHSQELEFELTRRDIPYDYRGGLKFFERAHIKEVIAFLKVINNIKDEVAWQRLLNMQIGIGEATSNKLVVQLVILKSISEVINQNFNQILSEKAQGGFQELQKIFKKIIQVKNLTAGEIIRNIIKSNYQNYLELTYPNFQERLDDLEQLSLFADQYQDLKNFLAEMVMQENFSTVRIRPNSDNDQEGKVILSTIHQAKGLEWETVFIINLTDGALPNQRALKEVGGIEEERRLFYVAVTRAKKYLYLSYPLTGSPYLLYLTAPSPFLKEIPENLLEEINLNKLRENTEGFEGEISYLPEIDEL